MIPAGVLASARVSGWTPASISGLVAWYDAADTASITASGGAVSQWADKSGNARHVTQAASGLRPTTGTRTLNGANVIDFNGDLLVRTSVTLTQPYTVCYVGRYDTLTPITFVGISTAVNNGYSVYVHNDWRMFNGVAFVTGVAPDTNPHVFLSRHNGGSSSIRVDGVTLATADAGSVNGTQIVFGGYSTSNALFDGALAEVVVSSGALSGSDLTNLEAYLKAKWGTP